MIIKWVYELPLLLHLSLDFLYEIALFKSWKHSPMNCKILWVSHNCSSWLLISWTNDQVSRRGSIVYALCHWIIQELQTFANQLQNTFNDWQLLILIVDSVDWILIVRCIHSVPLVLHLLLDVLLEPIFTHVLCTSQ